jgi:NADH-quinone oxidoreductase subunit N
VPAYDAINQAAGLIIPEIILLATVCVMFLAAPFLVSESGKAPAGLRHRWGILSLLALAAAGFAWLNAPIADTGLGPFQADRFVWFIRGLTIGFGMLLTMILWDQIDDAHAAEAHACLLAILCGVNFVALSNDLVGIFLGLELVSIPTYILLYLGRHDWMKQEATI